MITPPRAPKAYLKTAGCRDGCSPGAGYVGRFGRDLLEKVRIMPRRTRHVLLGALAIVLASCIGCEVKSSPAPPPALTVLDVHAFGAVGDGVTDDRPAIQTALDTASELGVTVLFPAGRYLLGSATSPGDRILRTHPKQHLQGAGALASTLLVGDAIGDYVAVIGAADDRVRIGDWSMRAMGIDQRASAGSALKVRAQATRPRMGVRLGDHTPGGHVRILDCSFVDSDSVNVVYVFAENVTVARNVFSAIGGRVGTRSHDHSTVYVTVPRAGGAQVITGNRFAGVRSSGGARTAIETHGGRQTVSGNIIADYVRGMNITSTSGAEVPLVQAQDNRIDRVAIGIQLWAGGSVRAHQLGEVEVLRNTITLDGPAWQSLGLKLPTSGVLVTPSNTAPVRGLQVSGNRVTYLTTMPSGSRRRYTAAVSCRTSDPKGVPRWIRVDHNVFTAATTAIDPACLIKGAVIASNTTAR